MVTMPIVDGFTQDVITLVSRGPIGDGLRKNVLSVEPDNRAAFLQEGMIFVLGPIMKTVPPFIQSIVARVIMENVDWDAVVDRLLTVPENN